MKKIGILTLTRQNSLAYSVLKRLVMDMGYAPVCGEAIGTDCLFFGVDELDLVGHDFLADLFTKAGLSDVDAILISSPYSVNLLSLPKVIGCLRSLTPAPIILGGNEASNNYRNLMQYRYSAFADRVVDIATDFIVRGAAEKVLPSLLPLLDRNTMVGTWEKALLRRFLSIPNLVFYLPGRKALFSTPFSTVELSDKEIFSFVRYGEKSVAITLQRACIWAKKSRGGCLFCAIATQFGKDFHCAVQGSDFVPELAAYLKANPDVLNVDIWDDTFNIHEDWITKICHGLRRVSREAGRKIAYSCFLRPKAISERSVRIMAETPIRVAFLGADALTEDLSRRLRRGCTLAELNHSIEILAKGKIQPRLSLQLFSPESIMDDVGMTATVALSGMKEGVSSVHLHLYTFPLFGSDIYRLLQGRNNLKHVPFPLLMKTNKGSYEPYLLPFDYTQYDPDVEEIKRETYRLLALDASFYVKTYPSDPIDVSRLQGILKQVRDRCLERKSHHPTKALWCMIVLFLEDKGKGLGHDELLDLLSRGEPDTQIPEDLKGVYGRLWISL